MYNREWIVSALAQVAGQNMPTGDEASALDRCKDSVMFVDGALYVEVVLLRQAFGAIAFAGRRQFRSFGPRATLMVLVDSVFADEAYKISVDCLDQDDTPDKQPGYRRAVHLARALVQAVC